MNKFEREGYQFEILTPPFDGETFKTLRKLSDEWLSGRTEKGFSLGFFDSYYLNQADIAVARNADGEIIAFASIMPAYTDELTSIDLMRYGKDAPSGIMDFLFIKLFEDAKEKRLSNLQYGNGAARECG